MCSPASHTVSNQSPCRNEFGSGIFFVLTAHNGHEEHIQHGFDEQLATLNRSFFRNFYFQHQLLFSNAWFQPKSCKQVALCWHRSLICWNIRHGRIPVKLLSWYGDCRILWAPSQALYLLFLDWRKVFETIGLEAFHLAIKRLRIPRKMRVVIMDLSAYIHTQIQT